MFRVLWSLGTIHPGKHITHHLGFLQHSLFGEGVDYPKFIFCLFEYFKPLLADSDPIYILPLGFKHFTQPGQLPFIDIFHLAFDLLIVQIDDRRLLPISLVLHEMVDIVPHIEVGLDVADELLQPREHRQVLSQQLFPVVYIIEVN